MIDRKKYLEICQKVAVLQSGSLGVKKDVPKELRVKYKGTEYYPVEYSLSFNASGVAVHIAILHDIKAHSVIRVGLEEVEENVD